jgi:hypothetical protein
MLPEPQIIPPSRRRREEDEDFDVLVPLSAVAREFGKKSRTIQAWSARATLGFPRLIQINGRYFASRRTLEKWKAERLSGVSLGEA